MQGLNRWIAFGFLIAVIVFAIYYPYKFFSTSVSLHLSGPTSWQPYWWGQNDALIPLATRLGAFSIYLPAVIATQAMLLCVIWLTVLLIRGDFFSLRSVRLLTLVGGLAAAAGLFGLVGWAVTDWYILSFNPDHAIPFKLRYDSGEMGVAFAGLGLFLLGRVLRLVMLLDHENKEII